MTVYVRTARGDEKRRILSKGPGGRYLGFTVGNVIETRPVGLAITEVYFDFGHSIIVEMKECNFKRKLLRGQELRRIVSENMGIPIVFYYDPKRSSRLIIKPK